MALSLRTFESNLLSQKFCRDLGVYAYGHFSCRCQKHPWTNITVLNRGRTISGLPGRSFRCNLKRYPFLCNIERIASSGFVLLPRIRDIISERLALVRISTIKSGQRVKLSVDLSAIRKCSKPLRLISYSTNSTPAGTPSVILAGVKRGNSS